jgi:hypothetical protein
MADRVQIDDADAQPYRALACSVIWQGVVDAVLAEKCNRKSRAATWLFDRSDIPLTFCWWCGVAGVDAENIRARVRLEWVTLAFAIDRGLSIWQEGDDGDKD